MKSLRALHPLIWNHRGRLFLGIAFVVMTNIFAVWAPSMIGEGVNALHDANADFLVPLEEDPTTVAWGESELRLPQNLLVFRDLTGLEAVASTVPNSKQDVLDYWNVTFDPTASGRRKLSTQVVAPHLSLPAKRSTGVNGRKVHYVDGLEQVLEYKRTLAAFPAAPRCDRQ